MSALNFSRRATFCDTVSCGHGFGTLAVFVRAICRRHTSTLVGKVEVTGGRANQWGMVNLEDQRIPQLRCTFEYVGELSDWVRQVG